MHDWTIYYALQALGSLCPFDSALAGILILLPPDAPTAGSCRFHL